MNGSGGAVSPFSARQPSRRLLRARRRLRANLVQLLCALSGLALGLTLPKVHVGPTVAGNRLAQPLFTLGIGVIGVVSIIFTLLFGVVQWSASAFSPRLNVFRGDPLVWRTFAFGIGVFVFSVTAGLASGEVDRVSLLVPVTAVLAVLVAFALIRALQTRAFLSLQLAQVLEGVTSRGATSSRISIPSGPRPRTDNCHQRRRCRPLRRTVSWPGAPGVIQQLELRRLVEAAARADALVVFRIGVGDTVHEASPLADIHGGDLSDQVVLAAVLRGSERSFDQDPMLPLRLLADIGLRDGHITAHRADAHLSVPFGVLDERLCP